MMYTPEQAMHRALVFFGQGTGESGKPPGISLDAVNAVYDRYSTWVGVVKPGNTETPLQVWGASFNFDDNFRQVGRRAAELAGGGEIGSDHVLQAAKEIESSAKCPYCP